MMYREYSIERNSKGAILIEIRDWEAESDICYVGHSFNLATIGL
jgi:hypothetical protein